LRWPRRGNHLAGHDGLWLPIRRAFAGTRPAARGWAWCPSPEPIGGRGRRIKSMFSGSIPAW
jgi:hypothetical protein